MSNKWSSIRIKWLQGMMEFLVLFPIFFVIGIYALKSQYLFTYIISLLILSLIGIVFRVTVLEKKTWFYITFTILMSLALPIFLSEGPISFGTIYTVSLVVVYRGVLYGEREWHEIFPTSYIWSIGLPLYFIGYFFYRNLETLLPYLNIFTWAGLLMLFSTLFVSNTEHLKSATLSKEKKPYVARALKFQNRLFIMVMVLGIVFITNIGLIQHYLWQFVSTVLRGVIWFLSLFSGEEVIEEQHPLPEDSAFPPLEKAEPSTIALILEKILIVVLYILLVVVAVILLIRLYKVARQWIKIASEWITKYINQMFNLKEQESDQELYIDEKESTLDWKEWRRKNKVKATELLSSFFKRNPKWEELSNKEKIRYLYRNLLEQQMKTGLLFKPSNTPRETITEIKEKTVENAKLLTDLDHLYGKARYGKDEVKEEEIKSISSLRK